MVVKKGSNGIMKVQVKYALDSSANPDKMKIQTPRNYLQRSPIWDESDDTIFSKKYMEDDMFSVEVNGNVFSNLRYGTNIFHKKIDFPTPFIDDEYMVFFDTYGNGEFVFGFDRQDLQNKTEPTYDAVVSMPMLMNKSSDGFDIVLPIHTYFNSL